VPHDYLVLVPHDYLVFVFIDRRPAPCNEPFPFLNYQLLCEEVRVTFQGRTSSYIHLVDWEKFGLVWFIQGGLESKLGGMYTDKTKEGRRGSAGEGCGWSMRMDVSVWGPARTSLCLFRCLSLQLFLLTLSPTNPYPV
jgi:hypothetical protein